MTMNSHKIAIIGSGHMGSSLLIGLINNGHPADKIWASDPSEEKLAQLKKQFKVHTTTDNTEAVKASDIIILSIKPQAFEEVATHLQDAIQEQTPPLVISVAAGVREENIQKWLGGNVPIVRVMPNTPALLGCGASGLYANQHVNHLHHELAESIMRAVGVIVWVKNESEMDAVTALSGCGPAYFFLIMEALQDAAEELGLTKEAARLLTLQTALGAARMAMESNSSLFELREHVASPGGSTEAGLSVLEANNIRTILKETLLAAKLRAEELGKIT
jgi:pyrroline-5-carboxylate reductase